VFREKSLSRRCLSQSHGPPAPAAPSVTFTAVIIAMVVVPVMVVVAAMVVITTMVIVISVVVIVVPVVVIVIPVVVIVITMVVITAAIPRLRVSRRVVVWSRSRGSRIGQALME